MNDLGTNPREDSAVVLLKGEFSQNESNGTEKNKPLSVRDIKRLAALYQTVVSCRALHLCRSVPLEIFLAVMTSDEILVPVNSILNSVSGPEKITRRWLDALVRENVLLENANDSEKFISISPSYSSEFSFEI